MWWWDSNSALSREKTERGWVFIFKLSPYGMTSTGHLSCSRPTTADEHKNIMRDVDLYIKLTTTTEGPHDSGAKARASSSGR